MNRAYALALLSDPQTTDAAKAAIRRTLAAASSAKAADGVVSVAKCPKVPRGMNGLERRYAGHLEALKLVGEVRWWAFEPIRVRLAAGAYYRPDFLILYADGHFEAHETKGGFFREAARVRVKVAAERIPVPFVVVRRVRKRVNRQWVYEWQYERFGGGD